MLWTYTKRAKDIHETITVDIDISDYTALACYVTAGEWVIRDELFLVELLDITNGNIDVMSMRGLTDANTYYGNISFTTTNKKISKIYARLTWDATLTATYRIYGIK